MHADRHCRTDSPPQGAHCPTLEGLHVSASSHRRGGSSSALKVLERSDTKNVL
jgi:hypothetical protein